MDGRQKPDANPENAKDLNDDEIVDLTQVIGEGKEDDVIDLTNVLEQPEQDPGDLSDTTESSPDTDEAIIDLETPHAAVTADQPATPFPGDDHGEGIIGLTNQEETLEAEISETTLDVDEDAIDLLETVASEPSESEIVDADETALVDPDTEATLTQTLETIEAADLSLDEDVSPSGAEDIEITLSDENAEDDDIFDLTEIETALDATDTDAAIEDAGDGETEEEVIDLLNAAEPQIPAGEADHLDEPSDLEPALAADSPDAETEDAGDEEVEEEVIDLLDAVEPQAPTDEADDMDERTDLQPALAADSPDAGAEDAGDEETEEEVIDLLDAVEPQASAGEADHLNEPSDLEPALAADSPDAADDETEEEVIDLLDAVEPEVPDAPENEAADLGLATHPVTDEKVESTEVADSGIPLAALAADDDQNDALPGAHAGPLDEEATPPPPAEPSPAMTASLTEEQLEAALERTIHKVYAEKIEQLMIETIEKTVQREIEKIKQALMETDDGGPD